METMQPLATGSFFEEQLQNSLSKFDLSVTEMTTLRQRYEEILALQRDALAPLASIQTEMQAFIRLLSDLKTHHLSAFSQVEQCLQHAAQSATQSLQNAMDQLSRQAVQTSDALGALNASRERLSEAASRIAHNLEASGSAFFDPLKTLTLETIQQFQTQATQLQLKIEQAFLSFTTQMGERQMALAEMQSLLQRNLSAHQDLLQSLQTSNEKLYKTIASKNRLIFTILFIILALLLGFIVSFINMI